MADLADGQYLVQLWPGEQHLILPVITYDDVSRISDLVIRLVSDLKAETIKSRMGPNLLSHFKSDGAWRGILTLRVCSNTCSTLRNVSQGRGMSPDVLLGVRLNGTATRLAHAEVPLQEAVAEFEELAAGRADLLAAAAGSILGMYLARPGMSHPQAIYAVALPVLAGADVGTIVEHIDRARAIV